MKLQNKGLDDFEPVIKCLYETAFATENAAKQIIFPSQKAYTENCYRNYDLTQRNVSDLIVKYYQSKKQLQIEIKILRTKKEFNKQQIYHLNEIAFCLENRIAVLRRLIDSIACKLFDNNLWILKRLTLHRKIKEVDIQAIISNTKIAANFNLNHLSEFALVSDLTTFIDVGDFILTLDSSKKQKWLIYELKSGHVNIDLLNYLKSSKQYNIENDLSNHKANQLNRIMRQKERAKRVVDLINTGKGVNIQTNEPVELFDDNTNRQYYDSALRSAIAGANTKKIALCIVNDCFYILASRLSDIKTFHYLYHLVYPGRKCAIGKNKHSIENKQEIYLMRKMLTHPYIRDITFHNILARWRTPFFILPIENVAIDLLFNKMRVVLYLDIDKFISFCSSKGYRIEQLSNKITNIAKSKMPNLPLYNDKALKVITPEGKSMSIGDGLFNKMFFDLVTPLSLLGIVSAYCAHAKSNYAQK